jgi:hypothetical protein
MKSLGFIRVRRRTFSASYPQKLGAASYDLVRAVRIDGKPRHTFILGLGSLRDERPERGKHSLMDFWTSAITRMQHHGLGKLQRQQLAEAMVRKGVPLPSSDQCRWQKMATPWMTEPDEILGWLRT